MEKSQCAIRIENAYKRHASNLPYVLEKLYMTVAKSNIYSLLGASGCGKTTLLSCITGQNILNAGEIHLSISSKKQLGFMPQQISLYPEFTIEEMLWYYGLIYGMTLKQIRAQGKYLHQLLHLNHFKKTCGSLSGGQQRRVSLAITLMHDPDLLILDEPTSGIDPVIADEIWTHLLTLAKNGRTILITTHYIEEARRSHIIGLMRKGILLEEAPPQYLLDKYSMNSLEDVFLLLSSKQQQDRLERRRRSDVDENFRRRSIEDKKIDLKKKAKRSLESNEYIRGKRMGAQIWKHVHWMKRNPGVMSFMTLVPIACVLFFNLAIGHMPKDMSLGIVNNESSLSNCNSLPMPMNCTDYDEQPFSCNFIKHLLERNIDVVEFSTEDAARMAAKHTQVLGFLTFPANYSSSVLQRFDHPINMLPEDVDTSEIGAALDRSDFTLSWSITESLRRSFDSFFLQYTTACSLSPKYSQIPPMLKNYYFGSMDTSYNQFTGPALLTVVVYFMPFLFTTSALIMEKSKGITERSMIAGMTSLEIISSHMIIQCTVLVVQIVLSMAMQYGLFEHPLAGDPMLVFTLLIMQGLCGTMCGLMTALSCKSDGPVGLIIIGTSIPFTFLSGFIWPIQSIEHYTRFIANFIPITYPIDAFRSIAFRGYGLWHWTVYYGFSVSTVWIVGQGIVCWILVHYRNGLVG